MPASAPQDGSALQGLHVLVVDDVEETMATMRTLLEVEGAHVTAVGDAQAALEASETGEPFDLLLSDVAMPGMDGYELIQRLRAQSKASNLMALALTGFGRHKDQMQLLAAGFDAHLTKPVPVEDLLSALSRLRRPA